MSKTSNIPQFNLKNEAGQTVNFHLTSWGDKNQIYDFEKPHRHHFNEVLIFEKGGGTHDIDFTTYKSKSASLHFVASENVHLVLNSKTAKGCSLLFANDFMDRELMDILPFSKTHPVLELPKKEFLEIQNILHQIKQEYQNKFEGYLPIIQSLLKALLYISLRVYHKNYPAEKESSTLPDLIQRFLKLLKNQYTQHLNVAQYADLLNISSKHLIEQCKTHTGKTPLQHIKDQTISEAKKLLYFSPMSIKEVAYTLNFEDPGNFSKYFKLYTGYTPNEYREGIR